MDLWKTATDAYLARLDAQGETVSPDVRKALYEPCCRVCGMNFDMRGVSIDARHEHIQNCKPAK
jgi:hypothetical protein